MAGRKGPPGTAAVIGVMGESRPDLAWIAYAVALSLDSHFAWVQIGPEVPSSRELEVLEEVGLDRIERIDGSELATPASARNLADGHRSVERGTSSELSRPVPVPDPLRARLARARPGGSGAVVFANFDRALVQAADPEELLAAVSGQLLSLGHHGIYTMGGPPSRFRRLFHRGVVVGGSPSAHEWNPSVDWYGFEDGPWHRTFSGDARAVGAPQLVRRLRSASDPSLP